MERETIEGAKRKATQAYNHILIHMYIYNTCTYIYHVYNYIHINTHIYIYIYMIMVGPLGQLVPFHSLVLNRHCRPKFVGHHRVSQFFMAWYIRFSGHPQVRVKASQVLLVDDHSDLEECFFFLRRAGCQRDANAFGNSWNGLWSTNSFRTGKSPFQLGKSTIRRPCSRAMSQITSNYIKLPETSH